MPRYTKKIPKKPQNGGRGGGNKQTFRALDAEITDEDVKQLRQKWSADPIFKTDINEIYDEEIAENS